MTAAPTRESGPEQRRQPAERAQIATGQSTRSSSKGAALTLAAVVALALALRLWGIGWQLPWQFHPDESHYTWKAMDLLSQDTLNPKYFRNPSLFTYILLAEYKLLGFQPSRLDEQAATADGLWRPPSGVAFVGRVTSAVMGALTVLVIGWIGWRMLGPWTGVLGALFLAVAFIHVRDSHFATNDAPSVLLLVLSVAASASLLHRPRLRTYLLAGLLGGLATSTKYNAGLFVMPLVAAHAVVVWRVVRRDLTHTDGRGDLTPQPSGTPLTPQPPLPHAGEGEQGRSTSPSPRRRGGWGVRSLTAFLVLAGLVSLSAYLAGTPYTVLDFQKWLADFLTQSSFVDEFWEGQARMAPGEPYLLALGAGMGWPMLLLSVLGLVTVARRAPADAAVLAAFPIAYLLFMLRSELFFVRFALPAVPFLCLFAGAAVVTAASWVSRRGPAAGLAAGAALTLLAVAQPTLDTVHHNLLLAQEDTRILAERWALANVPPGVKMQVEPYTTRDVRPRAYGAGVWLLDTDLFNVNSVRRADPTAPLRGSTRYFMISSFQQDRFGNTPDAPQRQFYEALAREGRVVARFTPGRDGQSIPFDLENLYSPFWWLDRHERPGPTITVYELPAR